jgi:hypothetical protein
MEMRLALSAQLSHMIAERRDEDTALLPDDHHHSEPESASPETATTAGGAFRNLSGTTVITVA